MTRPCGLHGLRIGQMNLLVAIAYKEPIKPSQLCRALHLENRRSVAMWSCSQRNRWGKWKRTRRARQQLRCPAPSGHAGSDCTSLGRSPTASRGVAWQSGVAVAHESGGKLGFPARQH